MAADARRARVWVGEGRQTLVALEYGALHRRARDDAVVKRPYGVARRRVMAVDQRPVAPAPAGVMNLHQPIPWPPLECRLDIDAVIDRIDMKIGDIAEPAAARALENAREKFGLVHFAAGDAHDRGDVFQNERRVDALAHRVDVTRHDVDRFARMGQRRQMADVDSVGAGEAEMFAPPGRIETRDQRRELLEIAGVDALGRADGEIEPMRDDGEMGAQQIELGKLLGRGVEIMIRDDFDEVDACAIGEEIGAEGRAIAQPRAQRARLNRCRHSRHSRFRRHLRKIPRSSTRSRRPRLPRRA